MEKHKNENAHGTYGAYGTQKDKMIFDHLTLAAPPAGRVERDGLESRLRDDQERALFLQK